MSAIRGLDSLLYNPLLLAVCRHLDTDNGLRLRSPPIPQRGIIEALVPQPGPHFIELLLRFVVARALRHRGVQEYGIPCKS
jgi:hypothetical protein